MQKLPVGLVKNTIFLRQLVKLVQANAYFGLKDFHGNEIENGVDYVATVIAYDGSMEEYFVSVQQFIDHNRH